MFSTFLFMAAVIIFFHFEQDLEVYSGEIQKK